MINSLSHVSFGENVQQPKRTKTSIFYVNDIHGRTSNMEKITTASQNFDTFVPSKDIDKLKMCSGDTMLGQNPAVNKAANKFLNVNHFMATVMGNHECDQGPDSLLNIMKDATYKILGKNVKPPKGSKFENKITSSYVQEVNGNKYGVIALMPYDLFLRIKKREEYKDIGLQPYEQSVKDVQQEINEMKEKGIDKIIVLSHTGFEQEQKLAQDVEGIDVILGGHSHDLIYDLEEGKNLFYSKKTGEPTIITQAGRDGDHFGVLNIEFDENGVITKAQNNVADSVNFRRNMAIQAIYDDIMGKATVIGKIETAEPMPKAILKEENPHADFVADIMKNTMGTDIAMINAANLRGCFEAGRITDRDVSSAVPFKSKLMKATISEKDVVDAIRYSCTSMNKKDGKPGLMQVSGLKYTVNKNGDLLGMKFTDKTGKETVIDVNNPRADKIYTITMDDFIGSGGDGYKMLNKSKQPDTQMFGYDKDKLAIDYIKAQTEPIHIKKDGRITIVD